MTGNYINIVEDGVKILKFDVLERVIINTPQAGASIKIFDGANQVASIDGSVAGVKEYGCQLNSGFLTSSVSGITSCDATIVANNR